VCRDVRRYLTLSERSSTNFYSLDMRALIWSLAFIVIAWLVATFVPGLRLYRVYESANYLSGILIAIFGLIYLSYRIRANFEAGGRRLIEQRSQREKLPPLVIRQEPLGDLGAALRDSGSQKIKRPAPSWLKDLLTFSWMSGLRVNVPTSIIE
jgi:hypothetical protein